MHLLQDDALRGLLHGIYVGVSGILLKPLSGSLSLLSELCMGASGRIRTWGEEFHRGPPSTRKRPPRQFSALTTDMRGASAVSSSGKLNLCPVSLSAAILACHMKTAPPRLSISPGNALAVQACSTYRRSLVRGYIYTQETRCSIGRPLNG